MVFYFPLWDLWGKFQFYAVEVIEEPIVPDRNMLIVLQILLQVCAMSVVIRTMSWWTTAATSSELSFSDRRTSPRDHQIRLTNWLFCPKMPVFWLLQQCDLYFCTVSIFGVRSTYFVSIFQGWTSLQRLVPNLNLSILKNREEWHPNSDLVSIKDFFFPWILFMEISHR